MMALFVAGFIAVSSFVGILEYNGTIDKVKDKKPKLRDRVIYQNREKGHYYIKKNYYIVTKKTLELE